jgi:hypothetical protein
MTMKAIVGLLLGRTVAISSNAFETAATWGTREATFILKKIRRLTGDINLTEVAQRTFKYSFSSYSLLT